MRTRAADREAEVRRQRIRAEHAEYQAYVQRGRAENAEHQRDEYLAVLRLVAEGEDARGIARAVLVKWEGLRYQETTPPPEQRPEHEAALRHVDQLNPKLRRIR